MKLLTILLLTFFIFGCEDQLNKTEENIVTRPTICPEPNPELEPSPIKFDGIQSISNEQNTSLTINWSHADGYYQYHVIEISRLGRKIVKTLKAPKQKVKINNLTPDTDYTYLVKGIDEAGFSDGNAITLTGRTLPWPNFTNFKSLSFNGSQSVILNSSDVYDNKGKISASLWFKTGAQAANDQRLITLHHGSSAGTALSVGVEGENINLIYKDNSGSLVKNSAKVNYYDNSWHHVLVSYNKRNFSLFINGVLTLNITDSFIGLGGHPAHIGSYTGFQKGFAGLIDEVAIYKAPMGQNDANSLYNSGDSQDLLLHPKKSKLVSWYRLGDLTTDTSSRITDVKGNHNGAPLNISNSDFSNSAP